MNNTAKIIREEINNYHDTINAIVGFMNIYRYNDREKELRKDVYVFQGRKFDVPEVEEVDFVTPDIAINLPTGAGIVGEVKHTFPKNEKYWISTFEQLLKYDNNLIGWFTDDEKIDLHDIVLLCHTSRSRKVKKFYEERSTEEIKFERPFVIIEYFEFEQNKRFIQFRKEHGNLSDSEVNERLEFGIPIPMDKLIDIYSTIKLYDSEPPIAYLLYLIWIHIIIDKAVENPKFRKLRINQTLEVTVDIEEIINKLNERFSFSPIHEKSINRQPQIPKKEWITRACNKFVTIGEAKWSDDKKNSLLFFFRKYNDIFDYFIERCSDDDPTIIQGNLFGD
ncbi:MAG: hypothetical protein KJ607_13845 [Bacteroidetes bacterium]|nr:hypothetical protein [Bacteroidota bacterium]